MLSFLTGKVSERKLRLFACACCRRILHLVPSRHARKSLAVAERYSDGEATAEKLSYARGDARRAANVTYRRGADGAEGTAMWAVSALCEQDTAFVQRAVDVAGRCEAFGSH